MKMMITKSFSLGIGDIARVGSEYNATCNETRLSPSHSKRFGHTAFKCWRLEKERNPEGTSSGNGYIGVFVYLTA
jgi:hypothetical protein